MPLPFDPVEKGYWDQSFQNILDKLDSVAEEVKKKKRKDLDELYERTMASGGYMQK